MVPTATEAAEDPGSHIRSHERQMLGIELEEEEAVGDVGHWVTKTWERPQVRGAPCHPEPGPR